MNKTSNMKINKNQILMIVSYRFNAMMISNAMISNAMISNAMISNGSLVEWNVKLIVFI